MTIRELKEQLSSIEDQDMEINVLSYYFSYGVPKPIGQAATEIIIQDGKLWISGSDKWNNFLFSSSWICLEGVRVGPFFFIKSF